MHPIKSNHELLNSLWCDMASLLDALARESCDKGNPHDVHFFVSQQLKADALLRNVARRMEGGN